MKSELTFPKNFSFTTKEQELVLKASLLDRNEAISAWEEWESGTDLEGYHNDVFRLLPLLYHNLSKHGVTHPFMKRLKGVYKMFWYQNKKLLHHSSSILKQLHQSGIDTLLFKGAPLSILYYNNIGLRPMNDVDVLVKKNKIQTSIDYFQEKGWTPQLQPIDDHIKYHNGVGFADKNGNEFDIHWHPLIESMWEKDHDDFWDNSEMLDIEGVKTRAFCASDLLLQTIVHGIRWNPEPPVRWIPDSYYIINHHGEKIDWERFLYLTKRYNLHLKIKRSILYLNEVFHVNIPEKTLNEIVSAKVSKADRIEYEYILNDPEDNFSRKTIGNLLYHIVCFRDITGKRPGFKHLLIFPDYLRYRYGCKNKISLALLFTTLFFRKLYLNIKSLIFSKSAISNNEQN